MTLSKQRRTSSPGRSTEEASGYADPMKARRGLGGHSQPLLHTPQPQAASTLNCPGRQELSVWLSLFPGGLPLLHPRDSSIGHRAYGLFVGRPSAPGTGPVERAVKNTPHGLKHAFYSCQC